MKKKSKLVQSVLVSGHYISFKHSFATYLSEFLVFKLLRSAIWSRCAVLFKSKQTPCSWAGRWFRSAALHRTRLGTCWFILMPYLSQRPIADQRLSKAMGMASVGKNLSPIPLKIAFHIKKTWLVAIFAYTVYLFAYICIYIAYILHISAYAAYKHCIFLQLTVHITCIYCDKLHIYAYLWI